MQRRLFLARADMSMLDHCSRLDLHWLPVKDKIIFKIATFPFFWWDAATMPVIVSLYTLLLAHSVPVQMKTKQNPTLSCARWKLKGFGDRSFSVQVPPAHIRHCSSLSQFKTFLKRYSLLLPTLSYSNLFTGIEWAWFDLDFAADVFISWLMFCCCCWSVGGWGCWRDWEKKGEAADCEIVCVWKGVCGCRRGGGIEWDM